MALELFQCFTETFGPADEDRDFQLFLTNIYFFCKECGTARTIFVASSGRIIDTPVFPDITMRSLIDERSVSDEHKIYNYTLEQDTWKLGWFVYKKYMLAQLAFYLCARNQHSVEIHGKK